MKQPFLRRWIMIGSLLLLLTALAGTNESRQYYTIERASVTSDEEELTNPNFYESKSYSISSDGRYILFLSRATNIVAGVDYGLYLRDRTFGETILVNSRSDGTPGVLGGGPADISDDGRFVAFISNDPSLVPDDTNDAPDVFLKDLQTGEIKLIDMNPQGTQAVWGVRYEIDISPDGRYVTFLTFSPDMAEPEPDTDPAWGKIIRYDQLTETYQLLTQAKDQISENEHAYALSGNGHFLLFTSDAVLLPDYPTGHGLYVRDLITQDLALVNLSTDGVVGNQDAVVGGISEDGRYITFMSMADNLTLNTVPTCDTGEILLPCGNIYLRDRDKDNDGIYDEPDSVKTRLVSVSSSGEIGNNLSNQPTISADGRYIVYNSRSSNLVLDDTNGIDDVFVYDKLTELTSRVSIDNNGNQTSTDWGEDFDYGTFYPYVSADGKLVVFSSLAYDLIPDDTNGGIDVFVAQISPELVVNKSLENHALETGKLPAGLKLKGSDSDKRVCNKVNRPDKPDKIVAHKGKCAFQFDGEPDKTATLFQKLTNNGIYVSDTLTLNAYVKGKDVIEGGKIQLKVAYKNGDVDKTFVTLNTGTYDYIYITAPIITIQDKPKKVSMKVSYGGTTGRLLVDQLSVLINAESDTASTVPQNQIPLPSAPSRPGLRN